MKTIIKITYWLQVTLLLFNTYVFFNYDYDLLMYVCLFINILLLAIIHGIGRNYKMIYIPDSIVLDPGSFEEVKNDLKPNKSFNVNDILIAIYDYDEDHLFINLVIKESDCTEVKLDEDVIIRMISLVEQVDFKMVSHLNLNEYAN